MNMKNNKVITFPDKKEVLIQDRPIPRPEKDQVLIETQNSLVSTGTELTIYSGDYPEGSYWDEYSDYPFDPGYNNIGIVREVGDKTDEDLVGRRVATYGPHAKYFAESRDDLRFVPDAVPSEKAVFFTIAEIVMNGIRRSEATWGEAALIFGLGLLGQLTVRLCYLAGLRPVIGLDKMESRIELLPGEKLLRGFNVDTDQNLFQKAVELNHGRSFDLAFEVTGNPEAIPDQLSYLKDQGRFVILSSPRGPTNFDFHDLCNKPSYKIIGAHNQSHPPVETPQNPWTKHRHAELFFDYLEGGRLDISNLITNRVNYEEAPRIYPRLLDDRENFMGVLFSW